MNRLRTELSRNVVWHGRSGDLARLVDSALTYCSCELSPGPTPIVRVLCGSHQILADQHTLDHLAFARSVQQRLVEEEWRTPDAQASRFDMLEWTAFLAAPAATSPPQTNHRWNRWARLLRTPFAISLFALVVMLGVPAPSDPTAVPGVQIASWQTR